MPARQQISSEWARLELTVQELYDAGFSLLPLGSGPDGKAPMVPFQRIPRLPLDRVLAPMKRTGSLMYGVRLHEHVVLDLDREDDGLQLDLEKRFGPARVYVRTARGIHLYYRAPAGKLPNLKAEGLPVDVKSGPNAYVVDRVNPSDRGTVLLLRSRPPGRDRTDETPPSLRP